MHSKVLSHMALQDTTNTVASVKLVQKLNMHNFLIIFLFCSILCE